jgi:phosphoribosylformimino-5-aminoimidazole carboxamide ribotide isomerase
VTAATALSVDFSGGIKTDADVENVFAAGADYIAVGSIAVKDKTLFFKWLQQYGAEKILLGADVRDERLAVSGWVEQTQIGLFDFLEEMTAAGVSQVFCTDIGKDGMMAGPALDLYAKIRKRFPALRLIASGGVRSKDDLITLDEIGCAGTIVGKALYENLGFANPFQ